MKSLFYHSLFLFLSCLLLSCSNFQKESTSDKVEGKFELEEITVEELQNAYKNHEYTIKEVVQMYLDRIKEIDENGPSLNSVIQINPDALKIAEELDKEYQAGNVRGPMHGIPVLLKDNIDTHDAMETTAGSRALIGSHPLQDSWVAKKLKEAGAVILGKANLSEWANFRGNLSTSGWSGVGGLTKNPYILDRNPCGSSSGSGVSVSANLCMLAIGTETNGSIVCPSNNNGIVGIKPTVGLISRSGIIPISFTQDTPGPMARTVKDAAICLSVMTGIDSTDSKTLLSKDKSKKDYTQFLKIDGLKGKRIGLYKRPYGNHYKVDDLMNKTVDFLKSQGVEIIDIEKFTDESINSMSFQVMLYEYKDGLNKYFASLGENAPIKNVEDLIEFNKSDSIELRYFDQALLIMAQEKGDLKSAEYTESLTKMLKAIREEGIDKVMNENNLDAIIAPTGSPAWKTDLVNGDNYLLGSSSPAAISGYPSITVPMGFIDELPVGISFFGRAWSEPVLLEIAYAFEQATLQRRVPMFLKN
ncbi:MAG: amidase [Bacteroidales bacterium]|nr:amidase [Bacteroidales bacterium]